MRADAKMRGRGDAATWQARKVTRPASAGRRIGCVVSRPAATLPPSRIVASLRRHIVVCARLRVLPFVVCLLPATQAAGAWTPQKSGTLAWLRAVYFVDAARGWAAGGKGALLSTADGGRTWRARPRPTTDNLLDIFFTDARTGWLVCERNVYDLARSEWPRSYLLKTEDGGDSWSRVVASAEDADVLLTRVLFVDARRGWVFGELGALYSTGDGGATWERQRVPTQRRLLGASFLDAAQGWLVGAGGMILQTSNGGSIWRSAQVPATASAPARLNAVSFADARRGWAVGPGGLVLSTADGGRTWVRQNSNTAADLSDVKFFDASEGWAVGAEGTVLHTTDGGAAWGTEPSGTRHPLERISFVGRTRGWAVGFGGTIIAYTPSADAPPKMKTQREFNDHPSPVVCAIRSARSG